MSDWAGVYAWTTLLIECCNQGVIFSELHSPDFMLFFLLLAHGY